jgi:hypothetical protein
MQTMATKYEEPAGAAAVGRPAKAKGESSGLAG